MKHACGAEKEIPVSRKKFTPISLIAVTYCGNYEGKLLLDTRTGGYEQLPKDSSVYLTFNTESYPHYTITVEGIKAE